jgi:threonyl-tRNA synthetase
VCALALVWVFLVRGAPFGAPGARLNADGFRVDVDAATGTLQYTVRRGTLEKIPWLLIVGPKEVESGTVSVRTRDGNDRRGVTVDDFVAEARDAVRSRSLDV